ncbi:MAG: SMP-30/gluconolactonase/LRE family protein [Acidothermus sp.]|nr:SMP-30/gluconolactonase/LRE family protein [Acidothermus sp.]
MSEVEQITEPIAYHGEGPVWSPYGLRWVDMLAGDVLGMDGERVGRRHVGSVAAALRPRARGGMVIAVERGFVLCDGDPLDPGVPLRLLPELWTDPTVRMNDGGCDPHGRFYCGSMAYDQAVGRGTLYRLDPDGSCHVVLTGVTVSNGIDWSPDGTRVYYNDSPTHRVWVFDDDPDAGLTRRRVLVEIPDDDGVPDGLTVDAEGGIWVALYGGGAVHRYRPDGVLDHVIRLPVSRVTACTFGGADLRDLYITTSREGLPDGAEPGAGALFRARPGVLGRLPRTFAG